MSSSDKANNILVITLSNQKWSLAPPKADDLQRKKIKQALQSGCAKYFWCFNELNISRITNNRAAKDVTLTKI